MVAEPEPEPEERQLFPGAGSEIFGPAPVQGMKSNIKFYNKIR
jgi:hypothetical protein